MDVETLRSISESGHRLNAEQVQSVLVCMYMDIESALERIPSNLIQQALHFAAWKVGSDVQKRIDKIDRRTVKSDGVTSYETRCRCGAEVRTHVMMDNGHHVARVFVGGESFADIDLHQADVHRAITRSAVRGFHTSLAHQIDRNHMKHVNRAAKRAEMEEV